MGTIVVLVAHLYSTDTTSNSHR